MTFQTIIIYLSIAFFLVGGIGAIYRTIKGPSIVDRTIGLDTLITIFISVIIADIILRGQEERLSILLVLALLSLLELLLLQNMSRGSHSIRTNGCDRDYKTGRDPWKITRQTPSFSSYSFLAAFSHLQQELAL